MSNKVVARYLDYGNTSDIDDVNAGKTPAFFPSPVNYTPVPVASESVIMVSAHLKGIDEALAGIITSANYVQEFFTADGIGSDYNTANSFGFESRVDVYINGLLGTEYEDWSRTVSSIERKITSADTGVPYILPVDAEILVKLYDSNFTFADKLHSADGVTTDFSVTAPFSSGTKIDVFLSGKLLREGTAPKDYQRGVGVISFNEAPPSDPKNNIRIRVHSISLENEYFVGGVSSVSTTQDFEDTSKLEVYVNGRLTKEGSDYSRTSSTNTINFLGSLATDTTPDTEILVRIWL